MLVLRCCWLLGGGKGEGTDSDGGETAEEEVAEE